MDKLSMKTSDVTVGNVAKIAALWPQCVTERLGKDGKPELAIDFDKLRAELSPEVLDEGEERYQFTWPDKRAASRLANTPSDMALRPCQEESVGKDGTPGGFDSENLYIEGDNLEVLKLLREDYLGKVKMIYIDPPYNTGNDFVYNDDFAISSGEFEERGAVRDEDGNLVIDPMQRNTESNGRFHTDWLNMIYPRLKVARELLADDGVIFISIDDNEVENLRKVCDEVFGEGNSVGTLVLQTATDNNPGQIKMEHEYIMCYSKNKSLQQNWEIKKESAKLIQAKYEQLKGKFGFDCETIQIELRAWIKNNKDELLGIAHYDNVDSKGVFHDGDIANTVFGGYEYEIIHPTTGKPCKRPEKGWRFTEETMKELLANDEIMFGKDEQTLPKPKIRLSEAKDLLRSVIYEDGRSSTKRFERLMARDIFQNPKSETIIARLIDYICSSDDIVLDFFSGSGTTAEAVFLNNIKGKNLRFVLVQIDEDMDEAMKSASSKAKKTFTNAIKFLDSIGKPHTICEIGKERIRRAGKKIKEESPLTTQDLDIGFRVLKLDSSNMADVFYTPEDFDAQNLFTMVDNVKEGRTAEDLLFQIMPELNIPLSAKIEVREINGKKVFVVDDSYLVATFDKEVNTDAVKAMAQMKPQYFVMRDASAESDNVLDDFEQIFRHYSPDTVRKIL